MSKKRVVNASVKVHDGENIERALKRFKRLVEKAGVKKEAKARRYYIKPSEARRLEKRKSARNRRKTEKKDRLQKMWAQKQAQSKGWLLTHPGLDTDDAS